MLTDYQATRFIEDGFVKVEQAFAEETAAECRAILWRATGRDPDDPATWTEPVIRIDAHTEEPFRAAANSPRLAAAFDRLVGPGRWAPRDGLGTFPIRFPSAVPPGDDGWHLDASFQGDADPGDYFGYRVNVASRGRALLMLFLFSETGESDAPTRIRVGSHLDAARLLAPHGDSGLTMMEISTRAAAVTGHRPVALATGRPGDVYLCHPFLVHAAQSHRGTRPRFLAQPPLYPAEPYDVDHGTSPVEQAIRRGLGR
ncbi:phytanoyl-CoA dioxygenase [Streptomyces sulfonofaciens]|uniref:Phytanoyl-CoA dioxygenase n=1 Tax=Streptomyces sulfonofaciens TaxID=68272 RepID=A0A919GNP4_9ACTN|nr:phytanoyl-CoA dioxygenase [Streptomyces sulfonofaciens]